MVAGAYNDASAQFTFVGAGLSNTNQANHAAVVSGTNNFVAPGADLSVIVGGTLNSLVGPGGFIGGGGNNAISNINGVIGGGANNLVDGNAATIGGGSENIVHSDHSTISGGQANWIDGFFYGHSAIGGGLGNWCLGEYATVAGGFLNTNANDLTAIGGGEFNRASGLASTVPGGSRNSAAGDFSFAAGRRAQASHDGSFVWADSADLDFASTQPDQFLIRAGGGVGIGTTTPTRPLDVDGVIGLSDSELKSFNAGIATEAQTQLINIGINDDAVNRFGGVFDSSAQGGFLRVETRPGQPLFGFFGRSAQSPGSVQPLASISSDGSVRYALGTGRRFSVGSAGTFEIDGSAGAGRRLFVSASGRIGIGTNSPVQPLHLVVASGTGEGLRIDSADGGHNPAVYLNHTGPGGHNFRLASFGDNSNPGSFRIRDDTPGFGADRVVIDADGNVGIGTTVPAARLNVAGNVIVAGVVCANNVNCSSDRNVKGGFEAVDSRAILEKVVALPITRWHYTNDADTVHIGAVAQDFHASFEVGTDDKHIATVDADGVALAAIQGLHDLLEEKESEIQALKRRLDRLEQLVR